MPEADSSCYFKKQNKSAIKKAKDLISAKNFSILKSLIYLAFKTFLLNALNPRFFFIFYLNFNKFSDCFFFFCPNTFATRAGWFILLTVCHKPPKPTLHITWEPHRVKQTCRWSYAYKIAGQMNTYLITFIITITIIIMCYSTIR